MKLRGATISSEMIKYPYVTVPGTDAAAVIFLSQICYFVIIFFFARQTTRPTAVYIYIKYYIVDRSPDNYYFNHTRSTRAKEQKGLYSLFIIYTCTSAIINICICTTCDSVRYNIIDGDFANEITSWPPPLDDCACITVQSKRCNIRFLFLIDSLCIGDDLQLGCCDEADELLQSAPGNARVLEKYYYNLLSYGVVYVQFFSSSAHWRKNEHRATARRSTTGTRCANVALSLVTINRASCTSFVIGHEQDNRGPLLVWNITITAGEQGGNVFEYCR